MKKYKIGAGIFILVLTMLGILFYAIPNRPTVSETENRKLAECPELTLESVFDGSFMSDYSTYFSDNFPFREQLISCANFMKKYTGTSGEDDIQIIYVDNNDDMPIMEEDITGDTDTDDSETTPTEQEDAIPDVALDDGFTKNGLIISGDTALSIPHQVKGVINAYGKLINNFADTYPDVNVYCGVIPIASAFYLPEKFQTEKNDQQAMINNVYELLNDNVTTLDFYTNLAKHADEYIYLRTDHHWTGLGAYYAYQVFVSELGDKATPLSCYTTFTVEDCLGSLYNQIGGNADMRANPDTITAYYPVVQYTAKYWLDSSGTDYTEKPLIAKKINSWNKYMTFTFGDQAVIEIDSAVKNGRKLIIFKDSFANAVVPLLVQHFEKIYVLDPRYPTPSVKKLIANQGITDVLYLTNITNTSVNARVVELRRISNS